MILIPLIFTFSHRNGRSHQQDDGRNQYDIKCSLFDYHQSPPIFANQFSSNSSSDPAPSKVL